MTKNNQKTSEWANEYETEHDVEEKLTVRPARVMTRRVPSLLGERSNQGVELPLRPFEISSELGTSRLNIGRWSIHSKGYLFVDSTSKLNLRFSIHNRLLGILEFTHVTGNPSFFATLTTLFENPGTSDLAIAVLKASSASPLYPRLLATSA